MAEIVLSAFLFVLYEKLGSAALEKLARYKGINSHIKKWHRSLLQIQEVLTDASQKEITDQSVKRWLNDLQHLAYDIDDILDDMETEAIHQGFLHLSTPSKSTQERVGREYFEELLSRSCFQSVPNEDSLFVMHELATSVAGDFFLRLDNGMDKDFKKEVLDKYRHVSFVRERYETYKKFEAFKRAKSLRTFLAASAGVGRTVEDWKRFY
ncbi:hypothetical protein CTI12_AA421380 [Artemisia annua]|uniref:Disease resistance N-terminal domain-containing protein n=1 Tax=Artemisia annua TaxID=35608 RepID=A0A2U1M3Z3_ARTAN|nr:hypothetical protein CTI12_AA421380 [Artemisia annua]